MAEVKHKTAAQVDGVDVGASATGADRGSGGVRTEVSMNVAIVCLKQAKRDAYLAVVKRKVVVHTATSREADAPLVGIVRVASSRLIVRAQKIGTTYKAMCEYRKVFHWCTEDGAG